MTILNWIYLRPKHYSLLAVLFVFSVILSAGWFVDRDYSAQREIELSKALDYFSSTLEAGTSNSRAMGALILMGAENHSVQALAAGASRKDAGQARGVDTHTDVALALEWVRKLYYIDTAFMVNKQGVIAAYSSNDNAKEVGKDVAYRPFFQLAMAGDSNVYPVIGSNVDDRGIYLTAPVLSDNRSPKSVAAPVGAVIVKVSAAKLDDLLKTWAGGPAVLLSPHGVVYGSNRADWLFRLTGKVNADWLKKIRESRQYGDIFEKPQLPALAFEVQSKHALIEGQHYTLRRLALEWNDPAGEWTFLLFDKQNPWWQRHDASLIFPVLAGLLAILLTMWFFTLARNAVLQEKKNQQIKDAQRRLRELTDNAPVAILSFGSDLMVDTEYSRACDTLLGRSPAGRNVTEVLFREDAVNIDLFCSIIPSVLDIPDVEIRESMLSLLPTKIQLNEYFLKVEYFILESGKFMLVITDVTQEQYVTDMLNRERLLLELIVKAVSDSRNFFDTLEAFREFIEHGLARILTGATPPSAMLKELYREIHTYKGLLNQFSFPNTPKTLHDIESKLSGLQSLGDVLTSQQISSLVSPEVLRVAFDEDIAILTQALGTEFFTRGESVILSSDQALQLERLANRLLRGEVVDTSISEMRNLLNEISTLRKVTFKDVLMGFDGLLKQVAARVEKEIAPLEVQGGADIWIDPHVYRPFLHSLVHVFRNAVAHGIETPEARWEAGKNEAGKISCSVAIEGDSIKLTIADDGAGINLDALRQRAVDAGIYSATGVEHISDEEIAELIFKDNISTQQEVTELAGRGVGLAAVLSETKSLAGTVVVKTVAGQGTEFIFTLLLPQVIQKEMV
jgi:C4-dicarboxylate-specific signal transduction histidine kinase